LKKLEEIPSFICKEGDTNFAAYCDTDSVYIHAEPILNHLYPNFDEMEDKEKDEVLEKVALQYQDIITDYYNTLAKDCFNVDEHRLEMHTECVIRSAYFRATRRYAQWITKEEGIEKDTLDIKGLEFKKANFPPILGKFFKEILIDLLKDAKKEDITQRIMDFKQQILDGTLSLNNLGNPVAVKKLNKYTKSKARPGEIFSKVEKGAPAAVKAAVVYNDLLKFWGLNKEYSYITQGDKIKWIYLKPNEYHVEAIGFLGYEMPPKIEDFIERYADRKKIFDSILLNKLEGLYSDMGWDLTLNPYINEFFTSN